MVWTLHQNNQLIQQNAHLLKDTVESLDLQRTATSNALEQLQIDRLTRLDPKLECGYTISSFTSNAPFRRYSFVLRNVGTATATNIFMSTTVALVTSNQVFCLDRYRHNTGEGMLTNGAFGFTRSDGYGLTAGIYVPPLMASTESAKDTLSPGEHANANPIFMPDFDVLLEFWNRFRGDVLVSVYVRYNREKPAFHTYSGHFNFLFQPHGIELQTEETLPGVRGTVDRYYSIPPSQRFTVEYNSQGTDDAKRWDIRPGDHIQTEFSYPWRFTKHD
jgi:hypothetical protein